ncbi:hypothetical protein CLV62_15112 [Dysgonomonas alginatilytica]|uniref:Uncharacterized protein n=1 Tax=Dysgonomonas alginatilytica TaxID=1605892 RepID=A0A2V3PIA6_9BACT|nr:hypothetical protein [Dysgonomonas alginatilytica]PXV58117.1 hypothetical protein CLV62_15112 [Dysgonomonas alginatilytica]
MRSRIQVVYNEASIIIDSDKTFISFDHRYAAKGYPIPCELFIKPDYDVIDSIESTGIVRVDSDFTRYCSEYEVYRILLVPQPGYSDKKMIQVFSDLLRELNLT